MVNIRRLIFATAAIAAASIQGCGCSDSKKHYPEPEQTFTVSGTASKGILSNFEVSAHRFNNGVVDSTPVASDDTNNAGSYTLEVPRAFLNQPLLLRVRPKTSGSSMRCDLAEGCGPNVDFGDPMPVTDSSFQLDTVVPSASNNSTANITLLTDLAARLAQKQFGSGATLTSIQTAIYQSNTTVANRFGLVGDLTSLQVIDLTNTAAVRNAFNAGNSDFIHYASINAGIAQAASKDNDQLSFVAALNAFAEYYAEEGIAGNTTDESETSLADILAAARSILQEVQSRDSDAPQGLVTLLQNLLVEQQMAQSEEPDKRSPGTPSSGAGDSDLQKAKNMVADLRDFAASIGESSLGDGLSVGSVSEEFAMQIEAAEMTAGSEAGYLLEALAMAAKAIEEAAAAHEDDESLESYTGAYGIEVEISSASDAVVFSIDAEVEVESDSGTVPVALVITASNGLTTEETEDETDTTVTVDGVYRLEGSATSEQMALVVKPGSSFSVTGLEITTPNEGDGDNSDNSLGRMTLTLSVSLAQVLSQESDPLTVEGTIVVSLEDAQINNTDTEDGGSAEMALAKASLDFTGKVSNTTGESFAFSLAVSGNATGMSFVETWDSEGSSMTQETEEEFVAASISLAFTAQLTGIPNAVSVAYTLERTGLKSGTNSLVVRYPGKLFRFFMAVEDGEPVNPLTIINQDGAILTLSENEVEGENLLEGTIKINGRIHATIEERDTIIITYSDNEVESL